MNDFCVSVARSVVFSETTSPHLAQLAHRALPFCDYISVTLVAQNRQNLLLYPVIDGRWVAQGPLAAVAKCTAGTAAWAAFETGQPLVLAPYARNVVFKDWEFIWRQRGACHLLTAPLAAAEGALGALTVGSSHADALRLERVSTLVDLLSQCLVHAKVKYDLQMALGLLQRVYSQPARVPVDADPSMSEGYVEQSGGQPALMPAQLRAPPQGAPAAGPITAQPQSLKPSEGCVFRFACHCCHAENAVRVRAQDLGLCLLTAASMLPALHDTPAREALKMAPALANSEGLGRCGAPSASWLVGWPEAAGLEAAAAAAASLQRPEPELATHQPGAAPSMHPADPKGSVSSSSDRCQDESVHSWAPGIAAMQGHHALHAWHASRAVSPGHMPEAESWEGSGSCIGSSDAEDGYLGASEGNSGSHEGSWDTEGSRLEGSGSDIGSSGTDVPPTWAAHAAIADQHADASGSAVQAGSAGLARYGQSAGPSWPAWLVDESSDSDCDLSAEAGVGVAGAPNPVGSHVARQVSSRASSQLSSLQLGGGYAPALLSSGSSKSPAPSPLANAFSAAATLAPHAGPSNAVGSGLGGSEAAWGSPAPVGNLDRFREKYRQIVQRSIIAPTGRPSEEPARCSTRSAARLLSVPCDLDPMSGAAAAPNPGSAHAVASSTSSDQGSESRFPKTAAAAAAAATPGPSRASAVAPSTSHDVGSGPDAGPGPSSAVAPRPLHDLGSGPAAAPGPSGAHDLGPGVGAATETHPGSSSTAGGASLGSTGSIELQAAATAAAAQGVSRPSKTPQGSVLRRSTPAAHRFWLAFRDPALEGRYLAWHNAACARSDLIFCIIAMIVILAITFVKPYALADRYPHMWPTAFVFTIPNVVRALQPRRYLAWREWLLAACLAYFGAYTVLVFAEDFLATVDPVKATSLPWILRTAASEALCFLPLGFLIRFKVYLPIQLLNFVVALAGLPRTCGVLYPHGVWPGCQAAFAATVAAVGVLTPSLVIWYNEAHAGRAFLADAHNA